MKKKSLLALSLLGAVGFSGLTLSTLASCDTVASASLTLNYNNNQGSVSAVRESDNVEVTSSTALHEGDVIVLTITPASGYEVSAINGTSTNETTYRVTLKAGSNTVTITFSQVVAQNDCGFSVANNTIFINMDDNPTGVALSSVVTFNSDVTPFDLDMEYEEDNGVFRFDGTNVIGVGVGQASAKIYKASDGEATDANSLSVTIIVSQNSTDLDNFNTAAAFESYDAVVGYFDTSESARLSEMKIGRGGERTGGYINLWLQDTYAEGDTLPKLVLKKTISSGLKANTTYTLSYSIDLGGYDVFKISVGGNELGAQSSATFTTYYLTFTTGEDVSAVDFRLEISYSGTAADEGLQLWGHLGAMNLSEGDNRPVEVTRSNYIRDGEFEYKDPDTNYGDPDTWTLTNGNSLLFYSSEWSHTGNALTYSGKGLTNGLLSYTQEFTVPYTGLYDFEYIISAGGAEGQYNGEYFNQLYLEVSSPDASLFKTDSTNLAGSDLQIRTKDDLSLEAGVTYTVGLYLEVTNADNWAYAVVDSLGIYYTEEDSQVTIDGLHHVDTGKSITLDSNYSDTKWSASSEDVTLTPSEDGKSVTVTGVNVSEEVTITAKANNTEATHTVRVDSGYEPVADDYIIKDASFEQSGLNGGLIEDFWVLDDENDVVGTTSGIIQISTEDSTYIKDGSYYLNGYSNAGVASEHSFAIRQASTFQVSETGQYELSGLLVGGNANFAIVIRDSEDAVVASAGHVAWSANPEYSTDVVTLDATKTYKLSIEATSIGAGWWFNCDDITLEKYIEPVAITGETSVYSGQSITLTANKACAWTIESGADYASLTVADDGLTATLNANTGVVDQQVVVKATSLATGEEENSATHTVTILEASESLAVSANRTAVYGGATVTLTSNKEGTTYTTDNADAIVSGNVVTMPKVSATTTVTITATYGDETDEVVVTVYNSTLTVNGTLDEGGTDWIGMANVTGWSISGAGATNTTISGYYGQKDGSLGMSWTQDDLGEYTDDTFIYQEVTVSVAGTFNFRTQNYHDGATWGYFIILDSEGNEVTSHIWSNTAESNTEVELKAGTYTLGYQVDNCAVSGTSTKYYQILTCELTAIVD